eukprot:CFRG3189T1
MCAQTLITEDGTRVSDGDNHQVRFVTWEDFIDISYLQKYVDVITYDEFLAANGPELTVAVNILARRGIDFKKPLTAWISPCEEWSSHNANYDPLSFDRPGQLWPSTPLYTKASECLIGPASTMHLVPIINDHFAPMATVTAHAEITSSSVRIHKDPAHTATAIVETATNECPIGGYKDRTDFATNTASTELLASTDTDEMLERESLKPFSIVLSRLETMMWHVMWHTKEYWDARRHYVFSKVLFDEAYSFMKRFDLLDGNYIAIHLRRKDFLFAKKGRIPELDDVASQTRKLMKVHETNKVFIATDTAEDELDMLNQILGIDILNYKYKVAGRLTPKDRETHFADGQLAIIDQILCSRGKYFTGSFQSTFSNTIFEERTLLGYNYEMTYNYLCPSPPEDGTVLPECHPPTRWLSPSPVKHFVPVLGATTGVDMTETQVSLIRDEL